MARVKIAAVERARRAKQSARDKAASKPANQGRKKKSGKNSGGSAQPRPRKQTRSLGGMHPYTRMILDPCNAPLRDTPLPGREGSSVFRLPFRRVVTIPNTNTKIDGSTGAAAACTTMSVTLTPSALSTAVPGTAGGAYSLTALATSAETDGATSDATFNGSLGQFAYTWDPFGLSSLNSTSSLLRPVAACVKLEFYSAGTSGSAYPNTGSFIGYEGVAGNLFRPVVNGTNPAYAYIPAMPNSTLAVQGMSHTNVTQGVEAKVNYAAADPQWQEFKQLSNTTNDGSPDAADPDISGMPIACVAVGGATPGVQYVVTGAIVYEWVPSLALGVSALGRERPAVRNTTILDTVIRQVSNYGPMLVGVATSLAVGGPSLAISDLFNRLAISSRTSGGYSRTRPAQFGRMHQD